MAGRPSLVTRGLSSLSRETDLAGSPADVSSPAEQRGEAKRNLFKTMRTLPTQHYWQFFFDKSQEKKPEESSEYQPTLEELGPQIDSVQDFWKYSSSIPVENIKMRESLYLFKAGYRPVWEDRRNILGGSWTFRVPKSNGKEFWEQIQLMAIGEKLQEVLVNGDQLCGVGLSARFNSHLISIWHRDASLQKSIDALLECVLQTLPDNLRPRGPDSYFYKRHSDHVGFKVPPELQPVVDSQRRALAATKEKEEKDKKEVENGLQEKTTENPDEGE